MVAERIGEKEPAWTEKYRPRTLDQMVGMVRTIEKVKRWAWSWKKGADPKKKAMIFDGEPGVGKTTAALALANEMDWEVIELNASDSRNLESIRNMVTRGATSHDITDSGYGDDSKRKKKLILLDEADNLHERSARSTEGQDLSDRGGKRAIVELVKLTKHPVILVVNNLYGLTKGAGASLNFTCEKVKFRRLPPSSIARRLREICRMEGVKFDDDLIMAISERSGGDLRSALGDLQIICAGKSRISLKDIQVLGFRDTRENIFNTMEKVFNARSVNASRSALMEVDEDISSLMLWFSHNLTAAMSHPGDVDRGMASLSKADLFLGRVRRRQNYKLWSYARDNIATLCLARKHPNPARSRYGFPSYLKKMSRSKETRRILKETASAIGILTHSSIRSVKEDTLYRFGLMTTRDPDFAGSLVAHGGLEKEHLRILSRDSLKEKDLRDIMGRAEQIKNSMVRPTGMEGHPEGGLMDYVKEGEEEAHEGDGNGSPEEDKGSGPKQANLFDF